jgi:hypothetical protein
MEEGGRQMRTPGSKRSVAAGALIVCIVLAGLVSLARFAPTLRGAETPPGLLPGTSIARLDDGGVDVVMWDGSTWQRVAPPTVIEPLQLDDQVLAPRILSVLVSPDRDALALWVLYCSDQIVESDACTAQGHVYDIEQQELLRLPPDLAPVVWLSDGRKLLVEDYMTEVGAVYDLASGQLEELAAPDELYTLALTAEGVSRDGDLIAFSGESGEGIVDTSTGDVTWLPTAAAHNTPWMTISPDGQSVAVVDIRELEDNRLGGGELLLFETSGTLTATITSDNSQLDFNPTWAGGGTSVAFLRANASALRDDTLAYGSESENLPAAVVTYELSSHDERTILQPDAVRRNLTAPGSGDVLLFLQRVGARFEAHYVHLEGGQSQPLLADGHEHTAIGAPR